MGPNGSGKSTLAHVLAGRPGYTVTAGKVLYKGKDLLALAPEERAREGVFLAFQYPVEIPGVAQRLLPEGRAQRGPQAPRASPSSTRSTSWRSSRRRRSSSRSTRTLVKRPVNEGFSGGEKKRNEIFQMAVLEPTLAILDETDSGLDIDALRIVADGVNALRSPGARDDRHDALPAPARTTSCPTSSTCSSTAASSAPAARSWPSSSRRRATPGSRRSRRRRRRGAADGSRRRSTRASRPSRSQLADAPASRGVARRAAPRGVRALRGARLPDARSTRTWRYTNVAPIAGARPWRRRRDARTPTLAARDGPPRSVVDGVPRPSLEAAARSARSLGDPRERLSARIAERSTTTQRLRRAEHGARSRTASFVRDRAGRRRAEPIHLVVPSRAARRRAQRPHPRVLIVAGRAQRRRRSSRRYAGPTGALLHQRRHRDRARRRRACSSTTSSSSESAAAFHVAHARGARRRARSRFTSHTLAFGGALARTDIARRCSTARAPSARSNGLFVGRGRRSTSTTTRSIDHAKPHCTSRELYKGILDGARARRLQRQDHRARRTRRRPTPSRPTRTCSSRDDALVNTTPQLEILADDVKCTHGSTIGQLDAAALFYLRSRGIGEAEARGAADLRLRRRPRRADRVAPLRAAVERRARGALSERPLEPGGRA